MTTDLMAPLALPTEARERIADVLADYGLSWADLAPIAASAPADWRTLAAALLNHPEIERTDAALVRRLLGWRKLPDDYRAQLDAIASRLGTAA